jgi:hypothetical protein
MGVLKRYRKTATVEYMKKAVTIHRLLMYEILKDFGTKKHVKDLMLIKKCSDEETKAKIEELEKVINESNVDKPYKAQLVYPKHFRSYIRRRFYQLLADFNDAVCFIYTTWATAEVEHSSRLIMTNKALAKMTIENDLDPLIFINQYRSWRGDRYKIYNAHNQLTAMDELFAILTTDIMKNTSYIKHDEIQDSWFDV